MAATAVTRGTSLAARSPAAAPSSSGRAPAAAPWRQAESRRWRAARHPQQRPQLPPPAAAPPEAEQAAGALTYPTRRLSSQEAIDALYASQHVAQRSSYHAFYSSELGGVVADPALMVVQLDDHMLHRGHGVFDTAALVEGHLYQLDPHLRRFLTNAARANIPLPRAISADQMRRTILETAAASQRLNGYVRYWLSAGRGGFGLSGNECATSAFYCVVYSHNAPEEKQDEYLRGWRVKTSPVPLKPPFFAAIKSNNYLPNALALMDAQAEGFDQGIFVDGEGLVSEGPNMNLACITAEGTVVVPPFDNCLDGITVQRMMQLLPEAISGGMDGIRRLEQRPLSVGEAKAAPEVFLVGSSLPIMPVVQWDEQLIGDGTVGLGALQIRTMMLQDLRPRAGSDQHVEVPYGYLTGMDATA